MKCWKRRQIKKIDQTKPKRKGHVALIVGHTQASPGAFSETLNKHEYKINDWLANTIATNLRGKQHSCSVHYRDTLGIHGAYQQAIETGCVAVIELHFNSFHDPRAHGSEVLINERDDAHGLNERFFAQGLLTCISQTLGTFPRGIKSIASKGERGFYNLSQLTMVPSVLIEPFFGSNISDCDKFSENKDLLAENIAAYLKNYLK